jgi:hypothetical protein
VQAGASGDGAPAVWELADCAHAALPPAVLTTIAAAMTITARANDFDLMRMPL